MNIFVTMHNIHACVVSGITKKKKKKEWKHKQNKNKTPPPPQPKTLPFLIYYIWTEHITKTL